MAELLWKRGHGYHVMATSPATTIIEDDSTKKIAYSFVGKAAQNVSYIYWEPEARIRYEEQAMESHIMHGGLPPAGEIP
jgi:hypothetical protein